MPRANRHFLPGQLWHITHCCHKKSFLLKFARDRRAYLGWLFETKKRFGLCVLNYVVTSNHIHLLVRDTSEEAIAQSMQLVAGRTGQEYNRRKGRQGAYWEDRYHATAVEGEESLRRCLLSGVYRLEHGARWRRQAPGGMGARRISGDSAPARALHAHRSGGIERALRLWEGFGFSAGAPAMGGRSACDRCGEARRTLV